MSTNSTNENSLTVVETGNISFLKKIKNIFANLFSSKEATASKAELTEKEIAFNAKYENVTLEEFQTMFETGKIKEDEFPESKLEELKQLYVNQILKMDEDSIKLKHI